MKVRRYYSIEEGAGKHHDEGINAQVDPEAAGLETDHIEYYDRVRIELTLEGHGYGYSEAHALVARIVEQLNKHWNEKGTTFDEVLRSQGLKEVLIALPQSSMEELIADDLEALEAANRLIEGWARTTNSLQKWSQMLWRDRSPLPAPRSDPPETE